LVNAECGIVPHQNYTFYIFAAVCIPLTVSHYSGYHVTILAVVDSSMMSLHGNLVKIMFNSV